MCRTNLINACRNLQKAVYKQLQNHNQLVDKKDFIYLYDKNNNQIVDHIYKLSIISNHPELYHLRK